jgi:MoaA/NifB/PqqE/SkfB family radical SAM enzyme
MSDKYLMDSHKLMWHPRRVADWLEGKKIVPIHIDVGLAKGCNIKCHYCFGVLQGNEYRKGTKEYFPREALLNYLKSAGEVGVKSMAFIGEAEPTLNPALNEAIIAGSKGGIDIALGTNGILFRPEKEVLENLKWIRYNISAASDSSYRKLHGSKEFGKVIESISKSVEIKKKNNLETTIGLQMVLTPKDVEEVVPLAKLGRELGVDYFVIKQCSDTLESSLGVYDKITQSKARYEEVLKEACSFNTDHYDVIPKWKKIMDTKQDYNQCLGPPFLLYSSGDGKLFPCGMFFTEKYWDKFMMGDMTKNSFKEIFESKRYWEVIERVKKMGTANCYTGCRTHAINSFLWKLKHEPKHVNFV